jgi:hypothetical protein
MEDEIQVWALIGLAMLPVFLALVWAMLSKPGKKRPEPQASTAFAADPRLVADRLGADTFEASLGRKTATGTANGHPWTATFYSGEGSLTASVEVDLPLPEDVHIGVEGFFSREDPEVGSDIFDSVVRLQGDPSWLSAALDPEARGLILGLQSRGYYRFVEQKLGLSASMSGEGRDVDAAVHAATRLAQLLVIPPDDVRSRLQALASDSNRPGRLAALRLLAHHPDTVEARALAAAPPEGAERLAALVLDVPGAEMALHSMLLDADGQVRLAAIELLRQKGTIASVQPLRDAAAGIARHPTKDAVQAIQSRAGAANAGGLAVMPEGDGGELALTDDERGRLAISKETHKG